MKRSTCAPSICANGAKRVSSPRRLASRLSDGEAIAHSEPAGDRMPHEKIARSHEPQSPPWTSNASTASAMRWPTSQRAPKRYGGIFDYDRKTLRLNEVNAALENPGVWSEPKRAQELGREKKTLETVVETIDHLKGNIDDNAELFEMSKEEGDEAGRRSIEAEAHKLLETVEQLEFR